MMFDYVIIVKSKTRLEVLIERFNTKSQAKFFIENSGGSFEDYVVEDMVFKRALEYLQTNLARIIKNKTIDREYLPSYLFSKKHIILVLGRDGLVANTAKYSKGQPIVAVNPDDQRYDGVLLPFNISSAVNGVEKLLSGQAKIKTLRFAEAKMNDGQRILGFNDLFIGPASHVSARYRIAFNNHVEEHSSSGVIVSTRAGSTGWLSSIFNMAYGMVNIFEQNITLKQPRLAENQLLFSVREPFQSVRTQIGITSGIIEEGTKLTLESFMPTNGVIFSDGIENDFIKFNSGAITTISLAEEKTNLVLNNK